MLRFEMNLSNLLFFLGSFIHIRIFKQAPKYLDTGLKRPSGTHSPPSEASTQGLKCKLFNGTQAEKVGNPKSVKTV
jgi:hypothetical protein